MPGRKRRGKGKNEEPSVTLDPPAPPPPPTTPTALSFSEYGGIAERGNLDPEEWWVDVLKGDEPWPGPEQQAVMSAWWHTHVGYDGPTVAVWLAARGIPTTTSTMVVATPELGSALDGLERGVVSPPLTAATAPPGLLAFERDQYGVLGPVVADDKEIGTCVPLVEPRLVASARHGWLAGTSVAALVFGGLLGFMVQGTETSLLAGPTSLAPRVAAPAASAAPSTPSTGQAAAAEPSAFARMTTTFVRPVSTYVLDVDTPLLVTRYEWAVTGPEQASCYAPAQFRWSADQPVAIWDHPHDSVTHLPCAPNEDHANSTVTVTAYFADGSAITCAHKGAGATPAGQPDPCYPKT